MGEPISTASTAIGFWDKFRSIWKAFGPTSLEMVAIDQEWIGGVLVHSYRFRVSKPRFSRSASKSPISLKIPEEIDIAEFHLDMPTVQTRPVTIPASTLTVSTHDLIGNYLQSVRDGQEISVSLRIPCPPKEIVEVEESQQANCKLYTIRNPNDFPVRTCDIEQPLLLNELIREIQIVRRGEVVSDHRLMKLRKTFSIDFEAGKLTRYFPTGISASDSGWLERDRTEKNCILRLTVDLDAYEEIEMRLYYGSREEAQSAELT